MDSNPIDVMIPWTTPITEDDDDRVYYWVASLWRWSVGMQGLRLGGWRFAPFLSTPADPAFVEVWMVHEEDRHADWVDL